MFGENLKKVRIERNLSQAELANLLGTTRQSINRYERNEREPSIKTAAQFAEVLNVPLSVLTGDASPITTSSAPLRIPVLGSVPAGIPIEAIEDVIGWEELPSSMSRGGKEYFALRVSGDSMYPKYLDGDIVIVRRTPTCDSGDDCIVYVNGYDATLKTVILGADGSLTIRPLNINYPPRTFSKQEIAELPVAIAGVVAELRRKIKG